MQLLPRQTARGRNRGFVKRRHAPSSARPGWRLGSAVPSQELTLKLRHAQSLDSHTARRPPACTGRAISNQNHPYTDSARRPLMRQVFAGAMSHRAPPRLDKLSVDLGSARSRDLQTIPSPNTDLLKELYTYLQTAATVPLCLFGLAARPTIDGRGRRSNYITA
jgi:hypothetical protein